MGADAIRTAGGPSGGAPRGRASPGGDRRPVMPRGAPLEGPLDSAPVPSASASLYRRHRPRTFADVVGQDHVVRTLRNAIEQGKVHHAYLFVGSRGTGKTSMAKILAASLNCEHGPTIEPCGKCDSCRSIATATSLDVIEMDAASNNSVDDIRDLREKVAFAPVSGRHKVYILDEAHMLTTAAWNAFLKTLEEPPPNTIFVLATTEAAKVLPTVVDRCHRFDFARPSVPQIAAVLRRVAGQRGDRDPRRGDRADRPLRDGLVPRRARHARAAAGLLGPAIALEDVLAVLGAADADLVFGAVDAVAAGDQREALLAAARLAESRPRRRALLRRPRGPRARADGRADARRGARRAARSRPSRTSGWPSRRARRARRRRAAAGADRRRAARDEGRRGRAHAARAGAAEGGRPELRPVREGAAGPDRAARGPPPAPGPAAPPRSPAEPATAAGRAAVGSGPAPAEPARAPGESGRTAVAISAQVEGQPPVAAATTLPGAPPGGERGRHGDGRAGRRRRLGRARHGGRPGARGGRRRGRRARRAGARADLLGRRRALAGRLRRALAGGAREPRRATRRCSPRCSRAPARRRSPAAS